MVSLQLYHLLTEKSWLNLWSVRRISPGFLRTLQCRLSILLYMFLAVPVGVGRYLGILQEVGAGFHRSLGTVRVRVESRQEFWVSWGCTQCFARAPDFGPGDWVRVRFSAPSPDRWRRAGTSAPRRRAIAGEVGVAWMHAADFRKPVASRSSAGATSTSGGREVETDGRRAKTIR